MADTNKETKEAKDKEIKEDLHRKDKEELKEKDLEAKKEKVDIKEERPVEELDKLKKEEKKEKEISEKDQKETKLSALFKRKPLRLLLLLLQDKNWYPSLLARESNQSYIHTTKVLSALEDIGLVTSEFNGKKKSIKLTEKGEKIARAVEEITKNV